MPATSTPAKSGSKTTSADQPTAQSENKTPKRKQPTPHSTINVAPVRRFRIPGGGCWKVANSSRTGFIDAFCSGLMTDVSFTGDAPIMSCGVIESTGEGTGNLQLLRTDDEEFFMPEEAAYVALVEFRREQDNPAFYIKDTDYRVESCDFLLMRSNGESQYGWRTPPPGAPELKAA